ncbi:MAG TPA: NAD(P)-binding protein [Chitinophagaceae bacterium]|nr:NAD(P)-binding protein [Chitinophagaceae bacterium]
MSKQYTIIVGSGLSGLMLARMIKLYRDPKAEIAIVEKAPVIGGQYGSFNYHEHGYFDIGMHIYYESCIPEIDKLFTDLLPEEEWNILTDNYKDIAGIYFNGRLQKDTPYINLRDISEERWKTYVAEIFNAIRNKDEKLPEDANAYEILVHHFGKLITDELFVPVLEKLYLTHPDRLAEIATKFTTINRLALFDKEAMLDLMQSQEIRSRICYPDQMTLPPYRSNTQRGFYPKEYGLFRVMDRFREKLEEEGVMFFTSHNICQLNISEKEATSISLSDNNGAIKTLAIKELFWTAGLPPLAKALGIKTDDLVNDKKLTTGVYVNFLLSKMPEMGNLYYFYCFDQPFRSFRITNYSAYCPKASDGRGFPLCAEMWLRNEDSMEESDIINQTIEELKHFGVIDTSFKVIFAKVEKLAGGGFPLPSVKNISNMTEIKNRIKDAGFRNIIPTGVLAEKNVFFIKDVLIDSYNKVTGKNEKFVY